MNTKEQIIKLLDDKKAEQIEAVDLSNTDYFTDCVILANVVNEKQALAILDELKSLLKAQKEQIYCIESSDEWTVVDSSLALIHLMSPNYRDKYQLEQFLAEFKH